MFAKKLTKIVLTIGMSTSLIACGQKQNSNDETSEPTAIVTSSPTADPYAAPSGMYFSETTGLPITTSLMNQRPIAVMVDCESIAFPHYGISESDVVYDLRNSMKNDYITRFMVIYKDYANIPQIGSVRSTRPTNVWLAGEWNAILCHDGGDPEAFEMMEHDYAQQHLSGGFTRVDNGKAWEFTEYITAGEVASRIQDAGFDIDYNQYKQDGDHFNFVKYNTELDTSSFSNATNIQLPNPHNGTVLNYNTETKTYDLSMYGELHTDAEDNQVLSFKNTLLLDCDYHEITNSNIQYHIVDNSGNGYYITNGKMKSITWKKNGENEITHYYDATGNEIEMNRGKTYIGLIASDAWDGITIE
jgi:hypothetical protein